MTTISDLDDFTALDPFFRIIEQGLDGLADGGHFFDLLAEDVIFDYIITDSRLPATRRGPRKPSRSYTAPTGKRSSWTAATNSPSITTPTPVSSCSSTPPRSGRSDRAPYANRYISVLTITNRKVTHWRDYLDPVAVFNALGWPSH